MQWDIVLFSETRAPSSEVTLEGGRKLFLDLGDYVAAGAGILVHERMSPTSEKSVHVAIVFLVSTL